MAALPPDKYASNKTEYTVAGRSFWLEALDLKASQVADVFLAGYRFGRVTADQSNGKFGYTIRVRHETPPLPPAGLSLFGITHGQCATDGTNLYLVLEAALVQVHPPKDRLVELYFGDIPRERRRVARVYLLTYALLAALRRCGLYELHAAGVVEPLTGASALLIGDSGSGKSTLTLRLAASGWHYLSDDILGLSRESDQVTAWGLRRGFTVTAETVAACRLQRVPAALGRPVDTDPDKQWLEPDLIFPDRRSEVCSPRALFFTAITSAPDSRVVELSGRETMERLVKLSPWACYDPVVAVDYLQVLAQLVKQSTGYLLLTGRDILAEPARAAQLLAPYVKG